ncbi:MAG TPA: response regulator [Sulfuricurvum sp.]|nr:response regulator [Sulfuricurvum sp.]
MVYTELLNPSFVPSLGILTACAKTHSEPFVYTNLTGELIGVNSIFLNLFGASKPEEIPKIEEWFTPQGVELSFLLTHSGVYRGKIDVKNTTVDVSIRMEMITLGDEFILAIELKDTSALERARAAERYFNKFKKKLLVNISHEFRTPMNAIIGFVDLLHTSPLSSWQQEYVDLAGKSAHSMMRNIENLLELMQVESGDIYAALREFNPLEVFESFSMQFDELIEAKEIRWSVLIDPRLPMGIVGDQDKITTVLRNLAQNAFKFTPASGQILLEVLRVQQSADTIEVEYAISDTGAGIDESRMKTLLRPFSSAWENQQQGQDGMGVGLALSHKYIDMMDSHLMLASEVGRGSRFSFRISHPISDATVLQPIEGKKIALYSHEPHSTQSVLLEKYFDLFGLEKIKISSLINQELTKCDVVVVDIPHLAPSQVESLKETYPHLQIVAVLDAHNTEKENALRKIIEAVIVTPLLPTSLHKTLSLLEKTASADRMIEEVKESAPEEGIKNAKILVAEDNPINLRLLETILKQHDFCVTLVENGQKAVDAYLKESFDLVLMDIDMPVMDGLTANRLIKEIDKRDGRGFVPVIALTAHALIGDRERIISAGLDAHLAKPIDKNFLLQTIDRYLKMVAQKRQNGHI